MLCPWERWAVCSECQPCFALGDSKHEVTTRSEAHVPDPHSPSHCVDERGSSLQRHLTDPHMYLIRR